MGSHINCLVYKDLPLIRGCHLAMYDKNHKNYKLWCYKSILTYIIYLYNRNIITEAHYSQLVTDMKLSLSSNRNSHFWIRGQLTRGPLFLFHLNEPDFATFTTSLNFKSVLHSAFFSCHFSTSVAPLSPPVLLIQYVGQAHKNPLPILYRSSAILYIPSPSPTVSRLHRWGFLYYSQLQQPPNMTNSQWGLADKDFNVLILCAQGNKNLFVHSE